MQEVRKVDYKKLLYFFLPLATTPIMIGLTHSIINAALARFPFQEVNIAVYTVVRSLVMIISLPANMFLQISITYIDNRDSYNQVRNFSLSVVGIIVFFLGLMAFTPLGGWMLTNLIGLKGAQELELAYMMLKITILLPVVQLIRGVHQGIAISLEKTSFFIPGIVLRLLIISVLLWVTLQTGMLNGIVAAGMSWVGGLGVEGIFILGFLTVYYRGLDGAFKLLPTRNRKTPPVKEILKFFLPLGLMASLGAFLQPLIQSGIARGDDVTRSLAAYGIAWGVIALVCGPTRSLHQLSLVYTRSLNDHNWKTVFNFSLFTGLLLMLIIILIALTPPGFWILNTVIGVSPDTARLAQKVLLAFALYPFLRSFRETYWGLLMTRRRTSLIGLAKGLNILVVGLSIFFSLSRVTIQPAVLGAFAFSLGEGVESLFIWYYCIRNEKQISQTRAETTSSPAE